VKRDRALAKETGFLERDFRLKPDISRNPVSDQGPYRAFGGQRNRVSSEGILGKTRDISRNPVSDQGPYREGSRNRVSFQRFSVKIRYLKKPGF
jgi:hypothetical protein